MDNPSDGALLYHWLLRRDEERAAAAHDAMEWNTGARGGNLRERPFSSIWTDPDDEFVIAARSGTRPVPAACAGCPDYGVCGGGFRARTESVTGDPWGADPSCQLIAPGV